MYWNKNIFSSKELKIEDNKLNKILEKTKTSFFSKINRVIFGKSKIDDKIINQIEEILISSDVGVKTTLKIIKNLEKRIEKDKYINIKEIHNILCEEITILLQKSINSQKFFFEQIRSQNIPYVIMIVGVNGVGKTTTIGKLSFFLKNQGLKVIIGAADTFRAGAIDQLNIWANIISIPIIKHPFGSDPASVAFDTLESAKSKNLDIVIVDTAGRLHNKINLMNELNKIKRVMNKVIPNSPHEIILVLDASIGQNSFEQVNQFIVNNLVTSIIMTKLDGTAKGGVIFGISDQFNIPVKYVGFGEKKEDLEIFDIKKFVHSFFDTILH